MTDVIKQPTLFDQDPQEHLGSPEVATPSNAQHLENISSRYDPNERPVSEAAEDQGWGKQVLSVPEQQATTADVYVPTQTDSPRQRSSWRLSYKTVQTGIEGVRMARAELRRHNPQK